MIGPFGGEWLIAAAVILWSALIVVTIRGAVKS